jgi:hypothetical protein
MICLSAGRLLDEFKLGRELSRLEVRAVSPVPLRGENPYLGEASSPFLDGRCL